jgi:hypothetical protein
MCGKQNVDIIIFQYKALMLLHVYTYIPGPSILSLIFSENKNCACVCAKQFIQSCKEEEPYVNGLKSCTQARGL